MCMFGNGGSDKANQELTSMNAQLQKQLQEKTSALGNVNDVLNSNTLTKGEPVTNTDRVLNDTQRKRTIKTLTIGQNSSGGINIPK